MNENYCLQEKTASFVPESIVKIKTSIYFQERIHEMIVHQSHNKSE
jgi:hypothetical protein